MDVLLKLQSKDNISDFLVMHLIKNGLPKLFQLLVKNVTLHLILNNSYTFCCQFDGNHIAKDSG